jgi:hypothetical protein
VSLLLCLLSPCAKTALHRFVYGLAKFQTDSFEAEVAFAFRLVDLDGSGALEPHEALIVLRDALRSDLVGGVAEELSKTQEKYLRKVLDEVAEQTGRDTLGPTEFTMVCTRAPRVYLSAKLLYEKLCKLSKEPSRVVMALSADARQEMLNGCGRVSMNFSGQQQQLPTFGADALDKSVYKPTPKRILQAPPPRPALVQPGYSTLLAHRDSEMQRSDQLRASKSAPLRGAVEAGAGEMQRSDQLRASKSANLRAEVEAGASMHIRPHSPAAPGPGGPRQSQAAGAPLAPHLANARGGARPQSAGRPQANGPSAGSSRRLSA